MKIKNILISQPSTTSSSQYAEIISKYGVNIEFIPFFKIEPISIKDFRTQRINVLDYTAIVFTAKSTIDAFFSICAEMRVVIPETMKYFCTTESIALYLQKHIVYRKRKVFFGSGSMESVIESIGVKHKGESFLIATTDTPKQDVIKLFSKAKLKNSTAIFSQTSFCNMKEVKLSNYQIIVFYTPSDVKSLLDNYPDFKQGNLKFATFGSSTAKSMEGAGLKVEILAPTPESPSIAKALENYLEINK
jgi:uroporphyrinogen-III synthase